MSLIVNEQPVGIIDGVNKTFTFSQSINTMILLTVDGLTYLGTFAPSSGSATIVLADAPTVSIYGTYYSSPPPTPPPVVCAGKISVAQARDGLQILLKDISDVPQGTFLQWCNYINRFLYRYAIGIDPGRFVKEFPINTQVNVNVYPLPPDFRDMAHFETGLYYFDQNNNIATRRKLARTGYGVTTTGYFLQGTNINLTPGNWNQNLQLVCRYIPKQETLTNINQIFTLDGTCNGATIIPEEFLDLLVNALAVRYMTWDEEVGSESYADARFERTLTEFAKEIYREDSIYFLEDMTPYYNQTGASFWGSSGLY